MTWCEGRVTNWTTNNSNTDKAKSWSKNRMQVGSITLAPNRLPETTQPIRFACVMMIQSQIRERGQSFLPSHWFGRHSLAVWSKWGDAFRGSMKLAPFSAQSVYTMYILYFPFFSRKPQTFDSSHQSPLVLPDLPTALPLNCYEQTIFPLAHWLCTEDIAELYRKVLELHCLWQINLFSIKVAHRARELKSLTLQRLLAPVLCLWSSGVRLGWTISPINGVFSHSMRRIAA